MNLLLMALSTHRIPQSILQVGNSMKFDAVIRRVSHSIDKYFLLVE
jgi:hypothetical protein